MSVAVRASLRHQLWLIWTGPLTRPSKVTRRNMTSRELNLDGEVTVYVGDRWAP